MCCHLFAVFHTQSHYRPWLAISSSNESLPVFRYSARECTGQHQPSSILLAVCTGHRWRRGRQRHHVAGQWAKVNRNFWFGYPPRIHVALPWYETVRARSINSCFLRWFTRAVFPTRIDPPPRHRVMKAWIRTIARPTSRHPFRSLAHIIVCQYRYTCSTNPRQTPRFCPRVGKIVNVLLQEAEFTGRLLDWG